MNGLRDAVASALAAVALGSCGQPSEGTGSNQSSPRVQAPAQRPITGYGNFHFGMSFEDVLAATNPSEYNAAALHDCLADLPLRGCQLFSDHGQLGSERRDGIPYHRNFFFSRHDRLVEVEIAYEREHDITRDQCFDILGRTLDWANDDLGPLSQRIEPQDGRTSMRQLFTPRGTRFAVYVTPSDSNGGISPFMERPVPARRGSPGDPAPNNQRNVSLLGIYLGDPSLRNCRITLRVSEPDDRLDYDRGISPEYSTPINSSAGGDQDGE